MRRGKGDEAGVLRECRRQRWRKCLWVWHL